MKAEVGWNMDRSGVSKKRNCFEKKKKKQVGWQKGRLRETANGPAYGWMDVPAMPMVRGRQSELQDGFRRPAGRVRGCRVGEPTVKSARCTYVLR